MTNTLREVSFKYGISFIAVSGLILLAGAPFLTPAKAQVAEVINVWWPTNGAHVTGTQPFKALVSGVDVSQYEMFWQVDGGAWNWMGSNYTDYPHKEASVNLSGWTWRGSGPYVIDFSARKDGVEVATAQTSIYVDNGLPVYTAPSSTTTAAPTASSPISSTDATVVLAATVVEPAPIVVEPVPTPITITTIVQSIMNPLQNLSLYVNPSASTAQLSDALAFLTSQPTATWLGNWNANIEQDTRSIVSVATAKNSVPVLVAYNIPQRDCGGFSAGGSNNPDGYRAWIGALAAGIGSGGAVVILEPDALSQITCLSSADQRMRFSLLASAVATLKKNAGTKVYIDAGHSGWIDPMTMADRLYRANIAVADGFALNVSNFMPTENETAYGAALSEKVSGKHFVIDTSRNGNGSNGEWCNPRGRAIGSRPTTATGNNLVDAYLWIKVPGESDGYCNGGPSAGTFWPEYALELVRNARL